MGKGGGEGRERKQGVGEGEGDKGRHEEEKKGGERKEGGEGRGGKREGGVRNTVICTSWNKIYTIYDISFNIIHLNINVHFLVTFIEHYSIHSPTKHSLHSPK